MSEFPLEAIRSALKSPDLIEVQPEWWNHSMFNSITHGHPELIWHLFQFGLKKNFPCILYRGDMGNIPLHHAAKHGDLKAVKVLLDCDRLKDRELKMLDRRNSQHHTAAHIAIEFEQESVLDYLLHLLEDRQSYIRIPRANRLTLSSLIGWSIELNRFAILRRLVAISSRKYTIQEILEQPDDKLQLPLHVTARFNRVAIATYLLQLIYKEHWDHILTHRITHRLIETGTISCVHEAVIKNQPAMIEIFHQFSPESILAHTSTGLTVLHLAVIHNSMEALKILQRLLGRSLISQIVNSEKVKSPLHMAVQLRRMEMIPILIEAYSDFVWMKDERDLIPFSLAISYGYVAEARIILDSFPYRKDEMLQYRDFKNRTNFQFAIQRLPRETLLALVEWFGPSYRLYLDEPDDNDVTPFYNAITNHYRHPNILARDAVETLVELGATWCEQPLVLQEVKIGGLRLVIDILMRVQGKRYVTYEQPKKIGMKIYHALLDQRVFVDPTILFNMRDPVPLLSAEEVHLIRNNIYFRVSFTALLLREIAYAI